MITNSMLLETRNDTSQQRERILVVDDDDAVRSSVQAILEDTGFDVDAVTTVADALNSLWAGTFSLALVDLRLPGGGMNLLAEIQKQYPQIATIVMTGYASMESAIEAIRLGAYDYLVKPVHPEMLKLAVRHGLDRTRLVQGQQLLNALQRSETALRRTNAELLALQRISRSLSRSDTVERLLDNALDEVVNVLGVDVGIVSVIDQIGRNRITSALRGVQPASRGSLTRRRIAPGTPTKRVLSAQEPIVIDDLTRQADLSPLFLEVVAREHLVTYIGAPVISHGRVLAVLELASRAPRPVHPDETRLIELISGQIATALDNAQLVERLRERELKLQQLSLRVLSAQEAERTRISHDLHDDTAQSLTTLKLKIEMIKQALPSDQDDLRRQVDEVEVSVRNTLQGIRDLIADLRPPMLDDFGLVPTLKWLVDGFTKRHGVRVDLHKVHLLRRLPVDVETMLYRAIQEALANVAKHARAGLMNISLERTAERVVVIVQDDGIGFDHRRSRRGAFGLLGIRERLASLGGSLSIDSQRGGGTTLTMVIPLKAHAAVVGGTV
jgi:signal transduction histidine kinase